MVSLVDLMKYLLGVVVVLCTAVYLFLRKRYMYWEQRGVSGPKPRLLFGNMLPFLKMELTESQLVKTFYDEFPDEKFIGIYYFWQPVVLVRDLEMVKKICVTDFNHFTDHQLMSTGQGTDNIAAGLFFMEGDKWRNRRLFLSKSVAPRRLKEYSTIKKAFEKFLQNLHDVQGQDIDLTKFIERPIMEFLAASLTGLDITDNEALTEKLIDMGNKFEHPSITTGLKIYTICPALYKMLRLRTFPPEIWDFYTGFTKKIMASRKGGTERDDFVTLLMEHMRQDAPQIDNMDFNEVVSHLYMWFVASHHPTALTVSHVLLKLALNPDVLEKAFQEISKVAGSEQRFLAYEEFTTKLDYLDCVIYETMRLEPLGGVLRRNCTKTYKLSENYSIPVDTKVFIPVSCIHNDPAYFPEPKVFRPERFIENPNNHAFMGFGKGPRMCIGLKFADVMMKMILTTVLQKFKPELSDKMTLPMVYDPLSVFLACMPIGGIWVKFTPRESKA